MEFTSLYAPKLKADVVHMNDDMKIWIAVSALCACLASLAQTAPIQSGLPGSWEDSSNTISKIVLTEVRLPSRVVNITNETDIVRLSASFSDYTMYSGLPIGGLSWTNEAYRLDITFGTFGWEAVQGPESNPWTTIVRGDTYCVVTSKVYVCWSGSVHPEVWQQVSSTNGMDFFMHLIHKDIFSDKPQREPHRVPGEVQALRALLREAKNGQPSPGAYSSKAADGLTENAQE